MQAIFIAFDQAHYEKILDVLEKSSCRGFTSFGETHGKGSKTGNPHFGSHAWPSLGGAILTIVEDEKVDTVLEKLKKLDENKPLLGLRAFVWEISRTI
ncbi:MAG: hypothetical protein J1E82_06320 [Muribaculaceae bacterium]|nr:hypothetical protein [Muribaculaceae bacterium]